MNICIDCGKHRIVLIPSEGEPPGPDDVAPFYIALNRLLGYANERLRVVDDKHPVLCGESRAAGEAGALVSERLWLNPWVIEEYVEKNPLKIHDAELEIVAPWRFAYRGVFVVARAAPDHLLLLNQDRAFCARSIGFPADEAVRVVPCIAVLTLLPFKGGIVTDSKYLRLCDDLSASDAADVREAARRLTDLGVIASAAELIEYVSELPDGDHVPEVWRGIVEETYAAFKEEH
ncbi:hypothetical protein [Paratractidigestivibacter sp.]|uniref:hypothetical protein n=1 Tax=Paratractidigestivibacter sp. TaxID=2847316 RepID=UPI002AC9F05C|nr:hypothetical protein [Paratractidigestivibacter sp.]